MTKSFTGFYGRVKLLKRIDIAKYLDKDMKASRKAIYTVKYIDKDLLESIQKLVAY